MAVAVAKKRDRSDRTRRVRRRVVGWESRGKGSSGGRGGLMTVGEEEGVQDVAAAD